LSRGIGSLQQAILERVKAAEALSLNVLCWDLATERGGATPSVTDSFHSGFRRAVRRLVEENYIQTERHRLTALDDLISYYPFKTRDAAVKTVRLQLLPVVKAYLAWHKPRKFSPADNERHFFGALPDDVRADAAACWRKIEPAIFRALPPSCDPSQEAIFDLIVRGQQLFLHRPVRHRAPFTALLEQALAVAADRLPAPAAAELRTLGSIFPGPVLDRLKLKSDLYEIAHLGRDHSQQIKDDFIEYAMREAPKAMRSMRGFRPKRSEGRSIVKFQPIRDEPSPLVHKLLLRDALAHFEFLTLRQGGDQPQAEPQIAAGAGAEIT
jgi:hypothetical protein